MEEKNLFLQKKILQSLPVRRDSALDYVAIIVWNLFLCGIEMEKIITLQILLLDWEGRR